MEWERRGRSGDLNGVPVMPLSKYYRNGCCCWFDDDDDE